MEALILMGELMDQQPIHFHRHAISKELSIQVLEIEIKLTIAIGSTPRAAGTALAAHKSHGDPHVHESLSQPTSILSDPLVPFGEIGVWHDLDWRGIGIVAVRTLARCRELD